MPLSQSFAASGLKVEPTAVSVGTSATLIAGTNGSRIACRITNNHASAAVYLGSTSNVTATTGMPLAAGQSYDDIYSRDAWYAISAASTIDVRVLTVQVG